MGVYQRPYRGVDGKDRVSRYWYCNDPKTGKPRSLRVTSRDVAQIMWGEILRQHELGKAGVNTHQEARVAKPLALLEQFLQEKERLGRDARYVATLEQQLRAFLRPVDSIAELTP